MLLFVCLLCCAMLYVVRMLSCVVLCRAVCCTRCAARVLAGLILDGRPIHAHGRRPSSTDRHSRFTRSSTRSQAGRNPFPSRAKKRALLNFQARRCWPRHHAPMQCCLVPEQLPKTESARFSLAETCPPTRIVHTNIAWMGERGCVRMQDRVYVFSLGTVLHASPLPGGRLTNSRRIPSPVCLRQGRVSP